MTQHPLLNVFVLLTAGVLSVPIAKRVGLGAVLGYLVAGIVIGPFVLGLIGGEREDLAHIAEFGVVMMLFLIGLELEPARLWRLRVSIFGIGTAQVVASASACMAIGVAAGLAWKPALALGLIAAMSSTAIVLQVLGERGWIGTQGGQASFAVLLFQDIAVIPILALLPLLGTAAREPALVAHGVAALAAWQQALAVLGAVAAIISGGRWLAPLAFRFIARTGLREIFTATALLLVVGIALLMQSVGLSPALGAFLSGVVLANSEYRHELEGDIEPFKALLLGLFFIAVGAGIDFSYIGAELGRVLVLTAAMMSLKLIVLFVIGRLFQLEASQALLLGVSLAQGGEFAFVLIALAGEQGVLGSELTQAAVAAVALSMLLTPPLLAGFERWVIPRFQRPKLGGGESDVVDEGAPVIIAGFGRVGSIVGRVLRAAGVANTVLDLDPIQIEALRRIGLKAYYGDASRLDLLHAAGAERAKVLVLAIDDHAKTRAILDAVERHFPHLRVIIRVRGRMDAYELYRDGYDEVYRETLGSALDMSAATLRAIGYRAYHARRIVQSFRHFDERAARELAQHRHDEKALIVAARAKIEESERVLSAIGSLDGRGDHAWDNEPLRGGTRTDGRGA